jgi:hypothetical protein
MRSVFFAAGLFALTGSAATALPEEFKVQAAVAEAVRPAMVRVAYFLKYDQGDEPIVAGYRCPNCNNFHGTNAGDYVKDNRPLEVPGYLISPDEIISPDLLVQDRFISRIAILAEGGGEVNAAIVAYVMNQQAVILKPEAALAGVQPLQPNPDGKGPYFNVAYAFDGGLWQVGVKPMGTDLTCYPEIGAIGKKAVPNSLVVTQQGELVGITMNNEIAMTETWRVPISGWPTIAKQDLAALTQRLAECVEKGVFRVQLSFRSPQRKSDEQKQMRRYSGLDQEQEVDTELNTMGMLLDEQRLLIFAECKPQVTARLEGITAFLPGSDGVPAKFVSSLTQFGAIIAELAVPQPGRGLGFSTENILACRARLLPAAQIKVYGDKLSVHYFHHRIADFEVGRENLRFPKLPGQSKDIFLFDGELKLMALPLAHRKRPSMEQRSYYSSSDRSPPLPVACLRDAMEQLDTEKDPTNIPLGVDAENRIGWIGIELQPLNPELARANQVSELTDNGKRGALVAYVYPDSPAAKASLKEGDIVLNIYLDGDLLPIPVYAEEPDQEEFPWAEYDRIPDRYYHVIPNPWPTLNNSLAGFLTTIGMGKRFSLEYASGGTVLLKDFMVASGPDYFDTAKKYQAGVLGLTVKDLTCEVRRYFHKADDDPGVIVSKIAPGSKASVSGLKPYEIITQVNGQPVAGVKAFEALLKDQAELNLSVTRMGVNRMVKIALTEADLQPAAESLGPRANPVE